MRASISVQKVTPSTIESLRPGQATGTGLALNLRIVRGVFGWIITNLIEERYQPESNFLVGVKLALLSASVS